jgi:hypothetical protein
LAKAIFNKSETHVSTGILHATAGEKNALWRQPSRADGHGERAHIVAARKSESAGHHDIGNQVDDGTEIQPMIFDAKNS